MLSSCKHLNGIEGCTIDLSTVELKDFDLWPMFDLSPHKFRRAWLALSGNTQFVSLPEQVSKAWVHTLKLGYCQELIDISALGECSSVYTLKLNLTLSRRLKDISALGGYSSSLHRLDLSYCHTLVDISALGERSALHTLNMVNCEILEDISALAGCSSLKFLDISYCTGHGLDDISALGGCCSLKLLVISDCHTIQGVEVLKYSTKLKLTILFPLHPCSYKIVSVKVIASILEQTALFYLD